jgi:hypothetical protein
MYRWRNRDRCTNGKTDRKMDICIDGETDS